MPPDEKRVIPFPPLATEGTSPFKLICLADVESKPIDWLRENYLARGHLTLIGGDPDKGKSQVTIDTASRLSRGAHWPNGPRAPIGSTIFLCSEDDVADTIKPRAEAAAADTSKLHVLRSRIIKDKALKSFTLRDDLDMLGNAVTKVSASLVVLDAITSYMGKVDNSSTTDVRGVLDPLSQWAGRLGVAVFGVTHPPKAAQKNAIRQFTGSFAYVAAARLAFFSMEDPDDKNRVLFLAVKNNLGPKASGRGYRIATKEVSNGIIAPYIQWDDAPVDYTADQALAANNSVLSGGSALDDAKEFLKELLTDGPVLASEGEEAARARTISEKTLQRAKKLLGVKSEKDGYQGAWMWKL